MACQVVFSRRPAHATTGNQVIVKASAFMECCIPRTGCCWRESGPLPSRGSRYIVRLATNLSKPIGCQCRRTSKHQIRFDRVFVTRRSVTRSLRGLEQCTKCYVRNLDLRQLDRGQRRDHEFRQANIIEPHDRQIPRNIER